MNGGLTLGLARRIEVRHEPSPVVGCESRHTRTLCRILHAQLLHQTNLQSLHQTEFSEVYIRVIFMAQKRSTHQAFRASRLGRLMRRSTCSAPRCHPCARSRNGLPANDTGRLKKRRRVRTWKRLPRRRLTARDSARASGAVSAREMAESVRKKARVELVIVSCAAPLSRIDEHRSRPRIQASHTWC